MSYIRYDAENKKMVLYSEFHKSSYLYELGELLFSFLDLDLKDFYKCWADIHEFYCEAEVYDTASIVYMNDILKKSYPKTFEYLYERGEIDEFDYHLPFLYLSDNKDLDSSIYNHPYLQETWMFACGCEPLDALDNYFNLFEVQAIYNELVPFCFDVDKGELSCLSAVQKYYLYLSKHELSGKFRLRFTYLSIMPEFLFDKTFKRDACVTQQDIESIKKINMTNILAVDCSSPLDFITNEFYEMLKINTRIKSCKNCGKYFVLKGDYATEFCNRIPDGEKITCKRLAALKKRNNKLKENPILLEYQKAYKRNYARLSNKKITNEEFRTWIEYATQKRDEAAEQYRDNKDEHIVQVFKDYLGNK